MPHVPPEFSPELSDKTFEALIDFVLHYEYEIKQAIMSSGRATSHQRAQLAILRRMLIDLGIPASCVYEWIE